MRLWASEILRLQDRHDKDEEEMERPGCDTPVGDSRLVLMVKKTI